MKFIDILDPYGANKIYFQSHRGCFSHSHTIENSFDGDVMGNNMALTDRTSSATRKPQFNGDFFHRS